MNDISVHTEKEIGYDFIPAKFLRADEDEYSFRNRQQKKAPESWRALRSDEISILEANHNRCLNWADVLVCDPFSPELIQHCRFAGLVRLGSLERLVLEHHDMTIPVGLSRSTLIACDVGDNCAIHACSYICHYIIEDNCILINNNEIHASNHAKWGNGILKDGEPESLRVWLDVMNEAGGRSILAFDGMVGADATLWARRREDTLLMERFKEMTQHQFDNRRGEYGYIGAASVLKSNRIIKDVKIGEAAYIKGTNKLKNLTIKSSDLARTQIGEGVELVNGIIGYGCHVFYGCKAVRFVMGTNSSLKYGARLIHSVLGDNSTVSCCEILNNLIFPAHEQHHNTSFLVAALIKGQSNMAAGATIGSNHNSRANDGEIEAGRGFWPGLSTSVKHSSRFASYCLLAKGNYVNELDIPFPFALVNNNTSKDTLEVMPAYWWMYNMYALMRNEAKFLTRDTRHIKKQPVEFSPFAPDTAEEMLDGLARLERYTGETWYRASGTALPDGLEGAHQLRSKGRELLTGPRDLIDNFSVLAGDLENSRRPTLILKPRRAYKAYRHMLRWYAVGTLIAYFSDRPDLCFDDAVEVLSGERIQEWDNLGGQLVPRAKVEHLVAQIKSMEILGWPELHERYQQWWKEYPVDKAQHAWAVLCLLLDTDQLDFKHFAHETAHFVETSRFIENEVYITRRKDYTNPFRKCTFRGENEMEAVLGTAESAKFIKDAHAEMERWRARADDLLTRLSENTSC